MSVATTPNLPVDFHVPCGGCGYDLFASNREGLCPECGRAVETSVSRASALREPARAAHARSAAGLLLASSIVVGFSPAACLIALQLESLAGPVLMTLAFLLSILTSAAAQYRLDQCKIAPAQKGVLGADLIAAVGLVLVNFAGYVYAVLETSTYGYEASAQRAMAFATAGGFFLLCVTAWRAVLAYRMQAQLAVLTQGHKLEKFLKFMGWTKAVYETAWLACCWIPCAGFALSDNPPEALIYLAFGALFGLFGFAVIWLLMIIAHTVLLAQVRRATSVVTRAND